MTFWSYLLGDLSTVLTTGTCYGATLPVLKLYSHNSVDYFQCYERGIHSMDGAVLPVNGTSI